MSGDVFTNPSSRNKRWWRMRSASKAAQLACAEVIEHAILTDNAIDEDVKRQMRRIANGLRAKGERP